MGSSAQTVCKWVIGHGGTYLIEPAAEQDGGAHVTGQELFRDDWVNWNTYRITFHFDREDRLVGTEVVPVYFGP